MRKSLRVIPTLIVCLGAAVNLTANPVLTLNPSSGGISGAPGSLSGWGFTITNDSGYIEINSSLFCIGAVNYPITCNSPITGIYNDIIGTFNDIIVGPPGGTDPTSAMQGFDPVLKTGAGSFQISPASLPGSVDQGQIVLTYTLTDLDPNNPNAKVLGQNLVLTASASVTTSVALATPEPSTAGLLALALAGLGLSRPLRQSAFRPRSARRPNRNEGPLVRQ